MSTTLNVDGAGSVELTFTERGNGQPVLLLHGGAGPFAVVPGAELLARTKGVRAITPTHPGFVGTPRPDSLSSVGGLARVYAALLEHLKLERVAVIGNSIGGWIAAELALLAPKRLSSLVIVNAAGLLVPGRPMVDVFSLTPPQLSQMSFHDPSRFRIDPAAMSPEQRAMMAANSATLRIYGGDMQDPGLRARLAGITVPTLVLWGEADRVVDVEYGRAYAQAIPGAEFKVLAGTGHMPQLETPELFAEAVWPFLAAHAGSEKLRRIGPSVGRIHR